MPRQMLIYLRNRPKDVGKLGAWGCDGLTVATEHRNRSNESFYTFLIGVLTNVCVHWRVIIIIFVRLVGSLINSLRHSTANFLLIDKLHTSSPRAGLRWGS